jgi:hypothetical protein
MNFESFNTWLGAYGRAWETRDPQAAANLFTEETTYQETPFDRTMRGLSAIMDYWSEVPRNQDQIRFGYEILSVTETIGIAHWWATFVRIPSKVQVKLDGILIATLDEKNRCCTFKEWWHRQEKEQA